MLLFILWHYILLKIRTLVIIRFLFFYPIKIDILVTFERKTTKHGLSLFKESGLTEGLVCQKSEKMALYSENT